GRCQNGAVVLDGRHAGQVLDQGGGTERFSGGQRIVAAQFDERLAVGNERGAGAGLKSQIGQCVVFDAYTEAGPQTIRRGNRRTGDRQRGQTSRSQAAIEAAMHFQWVTATLRFAARTHRYFQCNSRRSSQPAAANTTMTTTTTMKISARLNDAL